MVSAQLLWIAALAVSAGPAAEQPTAKEARCEFAEPFGGSRLERAALCAGHAGRFVKARRWAELALKAAPKGYRAHYLVGWVQHQGEGNLPKARYHLEQAVALLTARYPQEPLQEPTAARICLYWTYAELLSVLSEQDLHEAVLKTVQIAERRVGVDFSHLRAWRLMKLKRWKEAEQAAQRSIQSGDPWGLAMGRTALCAIHSELHHREEAYRTCLATTKKIKGAQGLCVEFTNAGAAAEELFRFAEAERLLLSAAEEPPEGSSNPWLRLVRLYGRQGRMSELISAWREMMAFRRSREGYFDQQDNAETAIVGASILLLAGKSARAEEITRRAVAQPDRRGYTSGNRAQLTGAAAVADMAAKRDLAQSLIDRAAILPLPEALRLRARAAQLRARAAVSRRRAVAALADPERLVTTFRPEIGGALELPTWMMPEVIAAVGPGVALEAIRQARAAETLDPQLTEGRFSAYEAEAYWQRGDAAEAERRAAHAIARMHPAEAAILARVQAIGGAAALELGHRAQGLAWLRSAAAADPSLFRRLGLRLPIRIQPDGSPIAQAAAEHLAGVGRFEDAADGFTLRLSAAGAQLLAPDGTVISQARLPPRPKHAAQPPPAQRLAALALTELFSPTLDLTQADVRSLDGSVDGSQKVGERLDGAMEDILK